MGSISQASESTEIGSSALSGDAGCSKKDAVATPTRLMSCGQRPRLGDNHSAGTPTLAVKQPRGWGRTRTE